MVTKSSKKCGNVFWNLQNVFLSVFTLCFAKALVFPVFVYTILVFSSLQFSTFKDHTLSFLDAKIRTCSLKNRAKSCRGADIFSRICNTWKCQFFNQKTSETLPGHKRCFYNLKATFFVCKTELTTVFLLVAVDIILTKLAKGVYCIC